MKIAIKSQDDGWVLDQITMDFRSLTSHKIVGIKDSPDIVWSINTFAFPSLLPNIPKGCKSVVQIHHVNLDQLYDYDFDSFNKANYCIVPNKITEDVVSKRLNIPIRRLPYWLLSERRVPKNNLKVAGLKKEMCPNGEILIGSFVKDGNGRCGDTPKLAKNPDLFIEILKQLKNTINVKVLLAGYARNYVKGKLKEIGIPCVYWSRYDDINSLYDCLDWYLITSKYEGGPQSVLEASYRKVKVLSTNVGMSPEVLHSDCICCHRDEFVKRIVEGVDRTEYNYKSVKERYVANSVIPEYDRFFEGT